MNERATELDGIATAAIEAAVASGAGDAEAFCEDSTGLELRLFEGEVESLGSAGERGVGVRAWIEGQVGYAYGTDLTPTGIEAIGAAATEAARIADSDTFAGPPETDGEGAPIAGLADPSITEWDSARKVELARLIERVALDGDPRVGAVETTVYADGMQAIAIASTTGVNAAYEATHCYAYLQALASDGATTRTGLGFDLARSPVGLDPEAIGLEAANRAASLLGARRPQSRPCPVVLDETVAASFFGLIGGMLGADAIQRGRSPFAGRLHEEVASHAIALDDDGRDPDGHGSSPVDGEGVPRGRTELLTDGRLASFLYDSYSARRDKAESTGNAGRGGYASAPSVSTSNLVVSDGEGNLDALLARAGDGVLVTDVVGLHSGANPVSGSFSVGASGFELSGGERGSPLSEFTIAGDLVSMLGAVDAVASPGRWVPFGGSVRSPAILIGEMTVSGD